ncbi:uncharacterized protein LOC133715954 [Rosa rugosa]|uniref:uncharacterized protein LOC133715954 n=1 Tax=Rosa rugosa TaxID=74645 RepID=UPI002B4164F5|nr:uncharacterized protein LOC133715954 [Rosa rugosa]
MAATGSEPGSDAGELDELECQVTEMAVKIQEYRATVPEQLKKTLPFIIEAQRPVLADGSEPGTSGDPNSGQIAFDKDVLGDQTFQKINLLRDKISRNVAALPIVLKRLKECMSNIDKLDSQNTFIHPAFKRKRTS